MMTKNKAVSVGFISLGCPKNTVDSEKMLAKIADAGLLITTDTDNCDVVVINTCGFIAPAKAEALHAVSHAVDCKRNGTVKKVIVAGCLSQRMGKELFAQLDGIDAVVGLGERDNIAKIISRTMSLKEPAAYLAHWCRSVSDDRARMLIGPRHRAYLRISEGCDHKCSFCTIPSIRGRFRSKPQEAILAEAEELVTAGAVELNIIAQDTAGYGRDLKMRDGLAGLLKKLEEIAGLRWIRLLYLYPLGITDQLIDTIAESEKVVHYFDVPIQHIHDTILKAMRRPDSKELIISLIEKLRRAFPDVVLRTTVMAGFPGETDAQFAKLLDFIKWAEFDALGCFTYYQEPGTPAAALPNQVPERVKQQRFEDVMLAQQKIAFAANSNRIGTTLNCLIDSVDNHRRGHSRFYGQAPDIDGICIIDPCSARNGRFVETIVVGAKDYDLIVQQRKPPDPL